jgi:hypothetical protein
MMGHLQENQFAGWVMGENDESALSHLEGCGDCRREAMDFRDQLAAFRQAIFAAGEERHIRWTMPVTESEKRSPALVQIIRWAPRAAFAALVLGLALTVGTHRRASVEQPEAMDAADNALLVDIESDLSRSAPAALAPAETLMAQMSKSENPEVRKSGGTEQ